MTDSLLETMLDRRRLFFAAVGSAAAAAASSAPTAGPRLDLASPAEHLRIFRKFQSSEEDGAETFMHYSGVTFAVLNGSEAIPLYGMEGLVSARSWLRTDGSVSFAANEVAMHTDLATGAVLERWDNPLSGETVDVWCLRNGPLNYAISPEADLTGGGWRLLRPLPPGTTGFVLPATIIGDSLILSIDGQARRKNPLLPSEWPRESSGENLVYSEHNTWQAKYQDLASRDVPSPAIVGSWHSLKPWRHWMLMGQRPGGIFNHLLARKVASFAEAPRAVVAYAEKHFPQFLGAPREQSAAYRDDWSYFKDQRRPAPATGAD